MRQTTLALLLAVATAALLAGCSSPESTPNPSDGTVEGEGTGSVRGVMNVAPNDTQSEDEGDAAATNSTETDGE